MLVYQSVSPFAAVAVAVLQALLNGSDESLVILQSRRDFALIVVACQKRWIERAMVPAGNCRFLASRLRLERF